MIRTQKLPDNLPDAERLRWRVIDLSTGMPLVGIAMSADEATGEATMREVSKGGEIRDVKYSLGLQGLAIVKQ